MGDGLLSVRSQELFCNSSALLLGYGFTYKTDNKKKNNIYKKTWEPLVSQIKNFLRKCPFTGQPKT
jgi:hypothetical protein